MEHVQPSKSIEFDCSRPPRSNEAEMVVEEQCEIELAREIVKAFKAERSAANVALRNVRTEADVLMLHQVLWNKATNIVKEITAARMGKTSG